MPTSGAQWRYHRTTGQANLFWDFNLSMMTDTTISNFVYHRISGGVAYREQNKKIYTYHFVQDAPFIMGVVGADASGQPAVGQERLVMDFNAPVGSTYVRYAAGRTDTLHLQQIDNVTMNDGLVRKRYYLWGSCMQETWVEGVGVTTGGCFEHYENCTAMLGDNGYVLGSGCFVTPNSAGCQATMTSTMVCPNVFLIRNTSPVGYQFKSLAWQNCQYSSQISNSDSIIINLNNTVGCSSQFTQPYIYQPNSATVYLTLWNNAGTCYTQNSITVQRDTNYSKTVDYTINRISADSFVVRNITPQNTYTQAQFFGGQCSPNSNSRVTVFPLPNQECLATAPVPFGGCYPNIYAFSLTVSNGLCTNTKRGYLPHSVSCTTNCFFAGDTNRDSIANNMDLLPIALNIGNTGQARTNTNFNLDWVAHEPKTWTTITPNSTINASFSDCDNSGVITAADTTIILRNYGFKNNRKTGVFQRPQTTNTAPVLRCQFAADTLRNIQIPYRLDADIRIGDATQTIPNLYGVAFSINYDTTIAQKARINWDALAWLGTPAELLVLQKNNAEGKIDIAIARNDHQPRTGSGKLAAVSFFINDNNGGSLTNTTFQATVTDLKAIDQNGIDININGGTASVVLENMVLGAMTNRSETPTIRLYPNPTYNRQFRYELTGAIRCSKIEIINLLGQTIYTKNNPETDILLPETTNSGVYSVVFYTDKGRIVQKVVVME
jgi:Secretion system C-terminal sorting domain